MIEQGHDDLRAQRQKTLLRHPEQRREALHIHRKRHEGILQVRSRALENPHSEAVRIQQRAQGIDHGIIHAGGGQRRVQAAGQQLLPVAAHGVAEPTRKIRQILPIRKEGVAQHLIIQYQILKVLETAGGASRRRTVVQQPVLVQIALRLGTLLGRQSLNDPRMYEAAIATVARKFDGILFTWLAQVARPGEYRAMCHIILLIGSGQQATAIALAPKAAHTSKAKIDSTCHQTSCKPCLKSYSAAHFKWQERVNMNDQSANPIIIARASIIEQDQRKHGVILPHFKKAAQQQLEIRRRHVKVLQRLGQRPWIEFHCQRHAARSSDRIINGLTLYALIVELHPVEGFGDHRLNARYIRGGIHMGNMKMTSLPNSEGNDLLQHMHAPVCSVHLIHRHHWRQRTERIRHQIGVGTHILIQVSADVFKPAGIGHPPIAHIYALMIGIDMVIVCTAVYTLLDHCFPSPLPIGLMCMEV